MEIECIHKGQYRPYGDHHDIYKLYGTKEEVNEYVAQRNLPTVAEYRVECRNNKNRDPGYYYRGYAMLKQWGKNEYLYEETRPYTD